jgi:hypothetical protein
MASILFLDDDSSKFSVLFLDDDSSKFSVLFLDDDSSKASILFLDDDSSKGGLVFSILSLTESRKNHPGGQRMRRKVCSSLKLNRVNVSKVQVDPVFSLHCPYYTALTQLYILYCCCTVPYSLP